MRLSVSIATMQANKPLSRRCNMTVPISQLFTDHPASVGETYIEHFVAASGFALRLFCAAIACLLHGILPFLFIKTGSKTITELHECMVIKRAGKSETG